MNIFLCGYMGVGKSTVAKALAMKLKRPFIDLDAHIEYKTGESIAQIFESSGEAHFRELEYTYIQEILAKENQVVALGGGSLTHHNLHQRIRKSALLVYLEADPDFLFHRLKKEKAARPLISTLSDIELVSFIEEQLEERSPHYLNAQLRVNVQGKSPEEIISFISEYLAMI